VEKHFHPEIVYEEAPEWPGSQAYRGREAVIRRFDEYREMLGQAETEVDEIIELEDDQILLLFRYRSLTTRQELPVEHRWAYLFELRDGQLVHWRAYLDAEAAKRELGVA
jgi:ketosteroid isomerase-like protein